jgi:hypothetical protein
MSPEFTQDEIDKRAVIKILQDTGNMKRFMDGLFGQGNWAFDAAEDVWVTPNSHGPGYIVVKRGGDWFVSAPPKGAMS